MTDQRPAQPPPAPDSPTRLTRRDRIAVRVHLGVGPGAGSLAIHLVLMGLFGVPLLLLLVLPGAPGWQSVGMQTAIGVYSLLLTWFVWDMGQVLRVRDQLRRLGYDWVGFWEANDFYFRAGTRFFTVDLPHHDELATTPAYRPGDVTALLRAMFPLNDELTALQAYHKTHATGDDWLATLHFRQTTYGYIAMMLLLGPCLALLIVLLIPAALPTPIVVLNAITGTIPGLTLLWHKRRRPPGRLALTGRGGLGHHLRPLSGWGAVAAVGPPLSPAHKSQEILIRGQ